MVKRNGSRTAWLASTLLALPVQGNQDASETGEPPDIHLEQPSIRDLKATIKSLEEGIREYETPEHRNLEARIKLDAPRKLPKRIQHPLQNQSNHELHTRPIQQSAPGANNARLR